MRSRHIQRSYLEVIRPIQDGWLGILQPISRTADFEALSCQQAFPKEAVLSCRSRKLIHEWLVVFVAPCSSLQPGKSIVH